MRANRLLVLLFFVLGLIAPRRALADPAPDGGYKFVKTDPATGWDVIEIGPNCRVETILAAYRDAFRRNTGKEFTWQDIRTANPAHTIPACKRQGDGYSFHGRSESPTWDGCAEADKYLVLIAGSADRIKIPMTPVENTSQKLVRLGKIDASKTLDELKGAFTEQRVSLPPSLEGATSGGSSEPDPKLVAAQAEIERLKQQLEGPKAAAPSPEAPKPADGQPWLAQIRSWLRLIAVLLVISIVVSAWSLYRLPRWFRERRRAQRQIKARQQQLMELFEKIEGQQAALLEAEAARAPAVRDLTEGSAHARAETAERRAAAADAQLSDLRGKYSGGFSKLLKAATEVGVSLPADPTPLELVEAYLLYVSELKSSSSASTGKPTDDVAALGLDGLYKVMFQSAPELGIDPSKYGPDSKGKELALLTDVLGTAKASKKRADTLQADLAKVREERERAKPARQVLWELCRKGAPPEGLDPDALLEGLAVDLLARTSKRAQDAESDLGYISSVLIARGFKPAEDNPQILDQVRGLLERYDVAIGRDEPIQHYCLRYQAVVTWGKQLSELAQEESRLDPTSDKERLAEIARQREDLGGQLASMVQVLADLHEQLGFGPAAEFIRLDRLFETDLQVSRLSAEVQSLEGRLLAYRTAEGAGASQQAPLAPQAVPQELEPLAQQRHDSSPQIEVAPFAHPPPETSGNGETNGSADQGAPPRIKTMRYGEHPGANGTASTEQGGTPTPEA
jgi:hypothetical protein